MIVEMPKLIARNRALDFGNGFYATTNLQQAKRFSFNVLKRHKGAGFPIVSIYEFEFEKHDAELRILKFDSPNEKWFDFVCKNRLESYYGHKHDIIIGPVANDTVIDTFRAYELGLLTREQATEQLKIKELFNQFAFCSEKAIRLLRFIKSEEVSKDDID
jgi:hypothetical protein